MLGCVIIYYCLRAAVRTIFHLSLLAGFRLAINRTARRLHSKGRGGGQDFDFRPQPGSGFGDYFLW